MWHYFFFFFAVEWYMFSACMLMIKSESCPHIHIFNALIKTQMNGCYIFRQNINPV